LRKLLGVFVRNWRVLAFEYTLVETIHVIGPEWRFKRNELIDDTAQ
jgi:hypothetical protein